MNKELEEMWKEMASVQAKHKYGICLRRLKKTVKNLGQCIRYPGQDSERILPDQDSNYRLSHRTRLSHIYSVRQSAVACSEG